MVDSYEDRRKTSQPLITQNNYNDSAEEMNKMDILVCGTCYFVCHFVEEFLEHKENPCMRTDVIQPNTSDQKPQVWSFLLWKNAKHRANTSSSSWQLYQEWCALPENIKDTWIQAGQFLKACSTVKTFSKKFVNDSLFNDDDELSLTKAIPPNSPVPNSNKVLKKTKSGKYQELVVEKIMAKRITNKKTEYWVKYKGRPLVDEKYWEPAEALNMTCQELLNAFENKTYLSSDSGNRKRTLSQTGDLSNAGLLSIGNKTNKQKMDHVQQWIQDDTSGRIHGDDDDVAKKRLKTDGSEIDNSEDYEEFFLRRTGGIILRSEMKSCTKGPQSEGTGGGVKKKNLAAEIGLESEEEEEEGGKENIFGRKNVPAVLKPNDNKTESPPSPIPSSSSSSQTLRSKRGSASISYPIVSLEPLNLTDAKLAKPSGPKRASRKRPPRKVTSRTKSPVRTKSSGVTLDTSPTTSKSVYDQVEQSLVTMLKESSPVKTGGRSLRRKTAETSAKNQQTSITKRSKKSTRKEMVPAESQEMDGSDENTADVSPDTHEQEEVGKTPSVPVNPEPNLKPSGKRNPNEKPKLSFKEYLELSKKNVLEKSVELVRKRNSLKSAEKDYFELEYADQDSLSSAEDLSAADDRFVVRGFKKVLLTEDKYNSIQMKSKLRGKRMSRVPNAVCSDCAFDEAPEKSLDVPIVRSNKGPFNRGGRKYAGSKVDGKAKVNGMFTRQGKRNAEDLLTKANAQTEEANSSRSSTPGEQQHASELIPDIYEYPTDSPSIQSNTVSSSVHLSETSSRRSSSRLYHKSCSNIQLRLDCAPSESNTTRSMTVDDPDVEKACQHPVVNDVETRNPMSIARGVNSDQNLDTESTEPVSSTNVIVKAKRRSTAKNKGSKTKNAPNKPASKVIVKQNASLGKETKQNDSACENIIPTRCEENVPTLEENIPTVEVNDIIGNDPECRKRDLVSDFAEKTLSTRSEKPSPARITTVGKSPSVEQITDKPSLEPGLETDCVRSGNPSENETHENKLDGTEIPCTFLYDTTYGSDLPVKTDESSVNTGPCEAEKDKKISKDSDQDEILLQDSVQDEISLPDFAQKEITLPNCAQVEVPLQNSAQKEMLSHDSAQGQVASQDSVQGQRDLQYSAEGQIVPQDSTQGQIISQDFVQGQMNIQDSFQGQMLLQDSAEDQIVSQDSAQDQIVSQDSAQDQIVSQGSAQGQIISQDYVQGQVALQDSVQGRKNLQYSTQAQIISQDSGVQGQMAIQESFQGQEVSQDFVQGQVVSRDFAHGQVISQNCTQSPAVLEDSVQGQISQNVVQGQTKLTGDYVDAFCLDFLPSDHSNESSMTSDSRSNYSLLSPDTPVRHRPETPCSNNSFVSYTSYSNTPTYYKSQNPTTKFPTYDPRNSGLKLPTARQKFPVINRPGKIKLVKKKTMSSQDTSSSPLPSPVSANPPSPFSQHSPSPSPIRPLPPCLPRVRPDLGREPFRPMGGTYSYPSYRHYNDPWGSDYPGESTPSALAASPKKKPPRKRKLEKKTALPTRKSYLKRFLADPNAAVIPSTWSPPQDNRAYEVPSETYELPSGNFVSSDPQHNVSQDGYIVPTGGSYDVHSTTYATNISYEVNNVYIDVAATSDYPQNTNVETPSQFTNLESATCYGKEILSQYKSAPSSHVLDTSSTEPCFVTDNQIYVIDQSTQPASYVTDESTWDTSQVLTDSRVVDTPQWQASQLTTQLTNKNAEESNHVTQVQESNSTQEMCVFSFLTPDCDEILVSYPKLYVQTDSTQSQQSCDTQDPLSYATHDSAAHAQWISPDDSAQGLLYAQELIPTADSMQTYYVESEARATLEGEKMASYLVDYERYFPAQHGNADQSTHLDEYAHNNLGNADQPAGGDQGYSSQEVQESPPLSGQMYQPCETPVQIVDPNIALSYSLVSTDKPNCFTIQVNPASNPGPLATPEPPTLSNAPDMPALCITTPGGEYAEQELNSTPGNPGIRLMNQELKSTTAPDVDSREQELELSTMLAGD